MLMTGTPARRQSSPAGCVQVSPSVTVKPPPLPVGVSALWAWLVAAVRTSDQEMLASCGLDAFMFVKVFTYGVQLFTPVAILSIAVLRESLFTTILP